MKSRRATFLAAAFGIAALAAVTLPTSTDAQQSSPVTAADYGQWETLGGGTLAPDGSHLAVGIRRVEGTSKLTKTFSAQPAGRLPKKPV